MQKNLLIPLISLVLANYSCKQEATVVAQKPSVIIIITNDQGYGDLGVHGNPHIKTPVLDKFVSESVNFDNFYVSPICAPTAEIIVFTPSKTPFKDSGCVNSALVF